jgi:hypothetical protein
MPYWCFGIRSLEPICWRSAALATGFRPGQPLGQPSYSTAAHRVCCAYHFSNEVTLGIMYLALIGDSRSRLDSLPPAVVFHSPDLAKPLLWA